MFIEGNENPENGKTEKQNDPGFLLWS